MFDGYRLGIRDIEGGAADSPRGQGLGQGVVIDQAAASDVHQCRSWLHRLEGGLVDEVSG
jgi:hypothetical protein